MDFPRTIKVLEAMANDAIFYARQDLAADQVRTNIRAKWKAGRLDSYVKKRARRAVQNTGELGRSLSFKMSSRDNRPNLTFEGADYADYVDKGRFPYLNPSKGIGKGIPPTVLDGWIRSRRIQPRELSTGRILPTTEANIKTMGFLMNRKIKHFGIEPTGFFTDSLKRAQDEHEGDLVNAFEQDVASGIPDFIG
jgi:hypothetical protein